MDKYTVPSEVNDGLPACAAAHCLYVAAYSDIAGAQARLRAAVVCMSSTWTIDQAVEERIWDAQRR